MADKPRAPIELRSAAVSDVRWPERIVELTAVPYDEWTPVPYKGRTIEESFAPGSFEHVERRAFQFVVNLEHELERRVGKVKALHPQRREGLVAELQIRRGPEGDQILDDCADHMLGGSVGFGVLPEHTEWPTRDRRRILKAFLDHIALTWTPAYAGAGVTAVRSAGPPEPAELLAPVPTPHLDRILAERLAAQYHLA